MPLDPCRKKGHLFFLELFLDVSVEQNLQQ